MDNGNLLRKEEYQDLPVKTIPPLMRVAVLLQKATVTSIRRQGHTWRKIVQEPVALVTPAGARTAQSGSSTALTGPSTVTDLE